MENFFNYVVEPRDSNSHLLIRATDDGLNVIIEVTDNGDGIAPDTINRILSGDQKLQKGSIGINNIKNRLKLLFGESYGLEIMSPNKPRMGTTIKLRFPMQEA